MRKIIILLSVVLIAGYSGLWFYAADKAKETVILQLESLKGKDTPYQISYEQIKVTGFPVTIHVEIVAPRVHVTASASDPADTSFVEANKLVVTPNFMGTRLAATVEGDLRYSLKENNAKVIQRLHCAKNPVMTAELKDSFLSTPIVDFNALAHRIKEFGYVDEGCAIEDTATNKIISQSERTAVNLKTSQTPDKQHFTMSFGAKGIESAEIKSGLPQGFGKSNLEGDLALNALVDTDAQGKQSYKSAELMIKEIKFSSPKLTIAVSGTMNGTPQNIMPIGNLRVTITHYENLVSYLAEVFHWKDTGKINALLRRASEKTESPETVDILIKGEQTGVTMGGIPFMEIMQVLK